MSQIKLNAIALYIQFSVTALVGLIVNPLLVNYIGVSSFGVWKSCQKLLDLSAAADGRATQALKWIIAHQESSTDLVKKQRDIGASILVWFLWLPIVSSSVITLIFFLPNLINNLSGTDSAVVRLVGSILAINIILGGILTIPDSVLIGTNQGYRSFTINTLFFILTNVCLLAVASVGWGLPALAGVTIAGSSAAALCALLVVRTRVSWWGVQRPRMADLRNVLSFSNWTLLWTFVQSLMLSTEVILITILIDPMTVTRYTFTSYTVHFLLALLLVVGSAVTPKIGALVGGRDLASAAGLLHRSRDILLALMTVAGGLVMLLNKSFVTLWVGPDFYISDPVNALIVVAALQFALIRFDAQIQDVGLRIGKKVVTCAVCAAMGLLLGAILYLEFRSIEWLYVGIILARLPATLYMPLLTDRVVSVWRRSASGAVAMVAVTFVTFLVSGRNYANDLISFAVVGFGVALLLIILSYFVVLSRETRVWLVSVIGPKTG